MSTALLSVEPFQETLHMGMCGPATLKMLLMFWKLPHAELPDTEIAHMVNHSPDLGISNVDFIASLSTFGLEAHVQTDSSYAEIESWLSKGIPVVVDWFTPGRPGTSTSEMPDGHYSIVVGLDDECIYLQDPELGTLRTIARDDFYRVWFDFDTDALGTKDDLVIRWMAAVYPKH